MSSTTPITNRIIADVRYAAGVELVRVCEDGLTLGDAGIARRQAAASKRNGNRGARAYWLGIARELRTRRIVAVCNLDSDSLSATCPVHGDWSNCPDAAKGDKRTLSVSPGCGYVDPDSELCATCGMRADWHDAYDMACPDDDGPHPYSFAADAAPIALDDHSAAYNWAVRGIRPTASERIRSARDA